MQAGNIFSCLKGGRLGKEASVDTADLRLMKKRKTGSDKKPRSSNSEEVSNRHITRCSTQYLEHPSLSIGDKVDPEIQNFMEQYDDSMDDKQVERMLAVDDTADMPMSGSSSTSFSSMISNATSITLMNSSSSSSCFDELLKEVPVIPVPKPRIKTISADSINYTAQKCITNSNAPKSQGTPHQVDSVQYWKHPKDIRHPGHSAPITSTTTATINGTLHFSYLKPKRDVDVPSEKTGINVLELNADIEPIVIAYDKDAQANMDALEIARGVQYEIARGVTQGWWKWSDVTLDSLSRLKGSNVEKAGTVSDVLGSGQMTTNMSQSILKTLNTIYAELDREHKALIEAKQRGLGLMGTWESEENWYGGKVQQIVHLRFNADPKDGLYSFKLGKLEYGRSNRITRFLGSVSVLQVRIAKDVYSKKKGNDLIDFLSRRHVLCGRVYVPFYAKENKIYLVETNEDFGRLPVSALGDHLRVSWSSFVDRNNPLELNKNQPISKWSTRWALGLSTSTPVLKFEPENIYLNIPDIYAEGEEHRTETMMTDGCGFMNLSALTQIAKVLKVPCPSGVQGRIAGGKGLWILHPDARHHNCDDPPAIWIRDSQNKIKLPPRETWDSLYMQTIQNMAENGVPHEFFVKLLEDGLLNEISPLAAWEGSNARTTLAKAIEKAGGISGSRLGRLAGHQARLYGYIRDEAAVEDVSPTPNVMDDDDDGMDCGLIERDSASGLPVTLYESTRELLQAGFSPLDSPLLREKLRSIVKIVTDSYMEQYHIPVASSAEAFIVPDPYGVLEEGQIYFCSSEMISDPASSTNPYTFLGPVLITRNPTGVASDVRKVNAVHHDKLLSYKNVIVFPTKGRRSLASFLGGGDYDGDTVTIIADQSIVNDFKNSSIVDEPADLRDNFEREVEPVSAFLSRVEPLSQYHKQYELCRKLLLGLSDSKVGLYSLFHDNAVYRLGYNHPDTIRLAYMFTTCLDSSKTGLRVKPDVFSNDSRRWHHPRPQSMQKSEESQRNRMSGYNQPSASRPLHLGRFVLDTLWDSGKQVRDDILCRYEKLCKEAAYKKDPDLVEPFRFRKQWAHDFAKEHGSSVFVDEINLIQTYVQQLYDRYVRSLSEYRNSSPRKLSSLSGISSFNAVNNSYSSPKHRRAIVHGLAVEFQKGPNIRHLPEAEDVKASYAYIHGFNKDPTGHGILAKEFAFDVAHEHLCAIKAKKEGRVSMTREFADYTTVHGRFIQDPARKHK